MTNDSTQVLFPDAQPSGPRLHNGAYTVAHEKHGHFSVKLYTATKGDLAGRRIAALLMGPNNETDWKGVGWWHDEPERYVELWRTHCSPLRNAAREPIDGFHWGARWNKVEQKLAIWLDLALRSYTFTERGIELLPLWITGEPYEMRDGRLHVNGELRGSGHWWHEGYTLLLEGRCIACNRKLTHPESIRLGIGPECRSK